MSEWISVEVRLPEIGEEVLCYRPLAGESSDPTIKAAYRMEKEQFSPQGVAHFFSCWCHPTHWMPLPQPPETNQ